MYNLINDDVFKTCVGYEHRFIGNSIYKYIYKVYDAKEDSCKDIIEDNIKEMLRTGVKIANLYLSEAGAVKCTYVNKEKLLYNGVIAVGVVYDSKHTGNIVGYDVVRNSGNKQFINMEKTKEYAFAEISRNMEINYLTNKPVFKTGGEPLYTRYSVDTMSTDEKTAKVAELTDQLKQVLMQLDEIHPIQFHDIDCDDCVYNFSNVVVDESENRVYIEIAMWHDNLPSHAKNPLKDSRGREILPQK